MGSFDPRPLLERGIPEIEDLPSVDRRLTSDENKPCTDQVCLETVTRHESQSFLDDGEPFERCELIDEQQQAVPNPEPVRFYGRSETLAYVHSSTSDRRTCQDAGALLYIVPETFEREFERREIQFKPVFQRQREGVPTRLDPHIFLSTPSYRRGCSGNLSFLNASGKWWRGVGHSVPSRRLSYVGIHRLPKLSGTASKGGMAA